MLLDTASVLSLAGARTLEPMEVMIEADFATLGFLIDSLENMFTFVEHPRYLRRLHSNQFVSAVVTTPALAPSISANIGVAISDDPRRTFFLLQNALAETGFYRLDEPTQVHSSARIHSRAVIADTGVDIGPDVQIGANTFIGCGSRLQRGVMVHPGAVIGASGFQTLRREGEYIEMSHSGGVLIEEETIVFANSTIARGLFRQFTRIGSRSRIGNNAFISHNAEIGENSFVGHGAVVNGNVCVGRSSWIGPGAVVSNGVRMGDGTKVTLGSVVVGDLDADAHVSGNFAVPHERFLRHVAQIR
jgi:UDP-3-O-[3-hydroxymyristoyl] glucosamine N-acyltransferase